jgi:hypothetical protein
VGAGSDQRRLCGIATVGGDGRRIDIVQYGGDGGLELALQKESWSIPPNTGIDLQIGFDRSAATTVQGAGAANRVMVKFNFDQSIPFMRSLRFGSQIRVSFVTGNEPVWTGGLAGSSRAIDAFNECRTTLDAGPPTQPFANGTPATPASAPLAEQPTGPTQPFSSPSIQQSQPAAPLGLPPIPQAPPT